MADPTPQAPSLPDSENTEGQSEDLIHDLESGIEEAVVQALDDNNLERAHELIRLIHYTDIADLLERVDEQDRGLIIELIRGDFHPEILAELDDTVRDQVIDVLGLDDLAAAVVELDSDDAVEVLEELEEHEQQQVLEAIPESDRALIAEGLAYAEDSAGRLMQRELVTAPAFWTVGDTIDYMRSNADSDDNTLPDQIYSIYLVDPKHHPVGKVMLGDMLRSRRSVPLLEITEPEMRVIPVETDQEDVALLFSKRNLVSAPVVDTDGRLIGAITIDDIVDVIHEEHEEDIMRMGGVREDDLYDAAIDTTKARFSWLFVNLLTAIAASVVIGMFDATIDQVVALAILMPIVASMGGNAGTQTLTVAVRALAMKELTATNTMRLVGKEFIVGSINGVLFAVLAGLVAWFWFESQALGLVIGLAMIVNMMVAGFAGTVIPVALDRAGVDPAIASSVLLTTVTDVVGFFVFLGLAALILL